MSRGPDPATTNRIVGVTLALLAERGYAEMTMASVAAAAGTSKSAPYRRWPSKAALVADALRHALQSANPLPERTADARADLFAILSRILFALQDTPYGGALSAVLGAAPVEAELRSALSDLEQERRHFLDDFLRRLGVAENQLSTEGDLLLGYLHLQVLIRRRRVTPEMLEAICSRLSTQWNCS